MEPDELTLADKGYQDARYFVNPGNIQYCKQLLARHETINSRLKIFGVLGKTFRHKPALHPRCFHAVANLTQLVVKHEHPLFHVPRPQQ